MPIARRQLVSSQIDTSQLVFVDDGEHPKSINGQALLSFDDFTNLPADQHFIALAISNVVVRRRLSELCAIRPVLPWSVRSDQSTIMDSVEIGEGALISPYVTIGSNVRIGSYFHANLYSYVEHDAEVGNFVTLGPGAKCNGNVIIEDNVYIGSGAMLKQGAPNSPLRIGRGATVGMGAVVTKDVEPGSTVVGNPARPIAARI